jgi:pyrroline-5-carboxylate reductase
MPNLPASIGLGSTAVARGHGAREGDEAFALELFRAVGPLVVEVRENQMDAFTAVSGSGPAYLFYLAQAMVLGAVDLGFEYSAAVALVRATISGAAGLLTQSGKTPSQLMEAVASKGGTTEAALAVLDEAHVLDAFQRALKAARDRGASMSS